MNIVLWLKMLILLLVILLWMYRGILILVIFFSIGWILLKFCIFEVELVVVLVG